jgi:hypothetical protein
MEQKDYLLREIEKIGVMLQAILRKLFSIGQMPSDSGLQNLEDIGHELWEAAEFDLSGFLEMDQQVAMAYLQSKVGFNADNAESLSIILETLSTQVGQDIRDALLEKSLFALEYGITLDKTYTFEREHRRTRLRKQLAF